MSTSYTITEDQAGQRLDVFCTTSLLGFSRAAIQRGIKAEKVLVNGRPSKPKVVLKTGDAVDIEMGEVPSSHVEEEVQDVKFPIIYEDRDVVVVNKPYGIAVHPGVGIRSGTVADWFAKRYPAATNVGEGEGRPGIVHRLDKDTSGVLILAKTEPAFLHLKKQFQMRRAKKEYVALVFGTPGGRDGRITKPIMRSRRNPMRRAVDEHGKEAATEWMVEEKFGTSYALLRLFPMTGRTHQIRVHLHYLGYPIVGDQLYTFKRKRQPHGARRQLLHAEKLTILLPNEKTKTFTAPLPEDFEAVVTEVSSHS